MQPSHPSRIVLLSAFLIAATAIVGYFVGLQSPMNPAKKVARFQASNQNGEALLRPEEMLPSEESERGVIPSTSYLGIRNAIRAIGSKSGLSRIDGFIAASDSPPDNLPTFESSLPEQATSDLGADTKISTAEKRFALAMRQKYRAYNGAPPTVPHSISEMSAESCVACHSQGSQTATLRISKMSHQYLSNCTQCHVGTASPVMPNAMVRANLFVGLPAPEGGPRAFAGAPPQIPHSTWMRVDCLSCHGQTSYRGLQTTHPWRQNCQQCHSPSSTLEQTQLEVEPKFIAPPQVDR